MPCVVDVGSIAGAVSVIFTISPVACDILIFWNTGVVLSRPTVTSLRCRVSWLM